MRAFEEAKPHERKIAAPELRRIA